MTVLFIIGLGICAVIICETAYALIARKNAEEDARYGIAHGDSFPVIPDTLPHGDA